MIAGLCGDQRASDELLVDIFVMMPLTQESFCWRSDNDTAPLQHFLVSFDHRKVSLALNGAMPFSEQLEWVLLVLDSLCDIFSIGCDRFQLEVVQAPLDFDRSCCWID